MVESNDPNSIVAGLGVIGMMLAAFWRLILWVRAATPGPEPWGVEIEASLQAEDAVPVCHRCLTPHSNIAWFCEQCGSAIGTYNNWMPYVYVFSEGEIFRNGVMDKLRASPLTITGYLLYSLGSYTLLAPIYWFFFYKNLKRLKREMPDELSAVVE
jgi:hypothetical protein